MGDAPVLAAKGLVKSFPGVRAVRGVDLTPLATACLQVGGELLRSPERHQEMFR